MPVLEGDILPAVDQSASFVEEVPVLLRLRVAPHSLEVVHMHMLPG